MIRITPFRLPRALLRWAAACVLLCAAIAAFSSSSLAGESSPHGAALETQISAESHGVAPVLAEFSWGQLFSPVRSVLGNRVRMVQFGTIACILALYIIWWRK